MGEDCHAVPTVNLAWIHIEGPVLMAVLCTCLARLAMKKTLLLIDDPFFFLV